MSLTEKIKMEENTNHFQLILIHFPVNCKIVDVKDSTFWLKIRNSMKENGTLWIIINENPTDSGRPLPFYLVELLQEKGFFVRNIILWYNNEYERSSSLFKNRVSYILFASKSKNEYKFHLDAIREAHIWKDFEWGGGRRSRYNPLGKNPSNFWIHTDSKKGKTIGHRPLEWWEVVERIVKCSTDTGDNVLGIIPSNRKFMDNKFLQNINLRVLTLGNEKEIENNDLFYLKKMKSLSFFPFIPSGHSVYFKSSERMSEVKNGSVQMAITSPPYWGLRDYGIKSQIGYGESYEEYLKRLEKVFKEVFRVLKQDGLFWLNINKRIVNGKMFLIPFDLLKICKNVGFYLLEVMIWFRPVSVPGTGANNFTDRYEFILVLAKSKDVKLDMNLHVVDFLCETPETQINVWKLYRRIGNLNENFRKKTNVSIKHTAVYPEELVSRAISVSTVPGDTVLDPFLGSGTTLSVANRMGRTGIGYEINPDFKPLIVNRLTNSISLLHFTNDI